MDKLRKGGQTLSVIDEVINEISKQTNSNVECILHFLRGWFYAEQKYPETYTTEDVYRILGAVIKKGGMCHEDIKEKMESTSKENCGP